MQDPARSYFEQCWLSEFKKICFLSYVCILISIFYFRIQLYVSDIRMYGKYLEAEQIKIYQVCEGYSNLKKSFKMVLKYVISLGNLLFFSFS